MPEGNGLADRLAASLATFRAGQGAHADSAQPGATGGAVPPLIPSQSSGDSGRGADWLDEYEERAGILEYDQGLPRGEAERIAWALCRPRADCGT